MLQPDDRSLERLRCQCGSWSRLGVEPAEIQCNGIWISGHLPTLRCEDCGLPRLPLNVKLLVVGMSKVSLKKGEQTVSVIIMGVSSAKTRFSFFKGVPLKYDSLDYFFIPGLERDISPGFLTPVFFSIEILPYFQNHPGYVVMFGSDTYGTLYTKDRGYISFGINRAKKLIMWLGDLDELSRRDLLMLAAHNAESDHDIGSEFYEAQIEAQFTKVSQEKRIIRAQNRFAEDLARQFGALRLLKMDKESVELLAVLLRPIFFTEDEFGAAMELMTKLFIERIDSEQLKVDLKPILTPKEEKAIKGYRELKVLQLWLEKRLLLADAPDVMCPLFVLYDLRVAYKHLIPHEKKDDLRLNCLSRLGLDSNATLENLYTSLIDGLEQCFTKVAKASEALRENQKVTK